MDHEDLADWIEGYERVRVEVRDGDPPARVYRHLWVVTLDRDGRCTAFEQWPFLPGQPRKSDGAEALQRIDR